MKELVLRTLFGGLYVALVVLCLISGKEASFWLFFVLSALCFNEAIYLLGYPKGKIPVFLALSWFCVWIGFYLNENWAIWITIAFVSFIFHMISVGPKTAIVLLTSVVYTSLAFALALQLVRTPELQKSVLFVFCIIWVNDTFAYVTGRLAGKNKLAPSISPGKTWEGFLGGLIVAMIAGYFIKDYFLPINYFSGLIPAVIIVLGATAGDLLESKIKRLAEVKDSGNILPGHGGALDRLDSFLFALPLFYLYTLIFI